jgi:hypothetical protein
LGLVGLGHCDAGPAHPVPCAEERKAAHSAAQARRKTGRPERPVGHQAEGKLFFFFLLLFFFFLLFFICLFSKVSQIKFSKPNKIK